MGSTGQGITADGEGRAFLIEWKGERLDALAVIQRGKVRFRTADGRMLGRATLIGQLVRPGEAPHQLAEQNPVWPVESPVAAPAVPAEGTGGHWAESAPAVVGPAPHLQVSTAPPSPTAPPAPETVPVVPPVSDLPEVRLVDGHWVATNADGSTDTVWSGPIRVAAVDRELSAVQLRLARLQAVRAAVSSEREQAIAEAVTRLAAADGVDDPRSAEPAQQAVWRRYAEVMVGE